MKITTAQWVFLEKLCNLELTDCKVSVHNYKEDIQSLIDAEYIYLDNSIIKSTPRGRLETAKSKFIDNTKCCSNND